jgi:uncharacterized protein YciW
MQNLFDTIVVRAAGISADSPLAEVLAARSNIIELTEASDDAALRPDPPGGLSHSERAALACRIARLNNEYVLAHHYEGMIESKSVSQIADTSFTGADDKRVRAIIRHTDLVATSPKDATADDISALKSAGVAEDDIVRLSELIAFVSYQIRVVAGLRLMSEAAS